jgi:hypothetical protein
MHKILRGSRSDLKSHQQISLKKLLPKRLQGKIASTAFPVMNRHKKYLMLWSIAGLALVSCGGSEEAEETDSCGFNDGMHEALVDYYNPDTDFSNTYTLDVEVEDCKVIKIEFPKGGWLDSDHIDPTDINTDGTCEIEDDKGRTYNVHIDN